MTQTSTNPTQATTEVTTNPTKGKRMTHAESRERNEKFADIVRQKLQEPFVANMTKARLIRYLRNSIRNDHNIDIPQSAAYKVMATIDPRFKPKQRIYDEQMLTKSDSGSDSSN